MLTVIQVCVSLFLRGSGTETNKIQEIFENALEKLNKIWYINE
jgi:hypothetical protein